MSFGEHGFLSPDMSRLCAAIRRIPSYKLWFDFAEELSRLGIAILKGHETLSSDRQRLVLSALFIRTHQSFQAAVILAERGLIGEARTILRTAVENAIASNALEGDPNFIEALNSAMRRDQLAMAREQLSDPYFRDRYSPEFVKELRAKIVELESVQAQHGNGAKSINWADVAKKSRKDLYSFYRFLSVDGVHTTVISLSRHLQFVSEKRVASLRGGPDLRDMVDTLHIACLTFLAAVEPFARVFEKSGFIRQIEQLTNRMEEFPFDEPDDAASRIDAELKGFLFDQQ